MGNRNQAIMLCKSKSIAVSTLMKPGWKKESTLQISNNASKRLSREYVRLLSLKTPQFSQPNNSALIILLKFSGKKKSRASAAQSGRKRPKWATAKAAPLIIGCGAAKENPCF